MKNILLKIFKAILILTLILLAGLMAVSAVIYFKWPWWVGIFVLIGFAGIWVGVIFLKKLLVKKREQDFVSQVIEQDQSKLAMLEGKEKERQKELQEKWKEAITALKKSHLKKQGNPLYVLPWYLVVGESGTGKTTAIKSARLSSTFAEVSRTSGISGTKNCDWWFFEQAIILDTAGRFAIPVDEDRDKEEWKNFLVLLAKFRKKEPINGLVVTVAADKLLDKPPEHLKEDGATIRRRIDELMGVLGAKFPVYVLVTKCDLIKGMTQFCDRLPENSLDQAMGVINNDPGRNVESFAGKIVSTVGERLRDLRLLLFHESKSRDIDPGLLLFPEEFERVEPGLKAFVEGAFKENPYQETPVLRGVYFSSGKQEGTPYSHFLKSLGLIGESEVLQGTDRGLFLYDFFSKILPGDRKLFTLTEKSIRWSRLTRNLGLTSWIALCIALCGLLSFSFVKNLKTLRDVQNPPVLQGEVLIDLEAMNNFRQAILKVEDENRGWWIPRLGLNESKNMEDKLKTRYCDLFRDGFLVNLDKKMKERIAGFSLDTPDGEIGRHVSFLVKRINLLHARIRGKEFDELASMPQPAYEPPGASVSKELLPEIAKKFQNLYLYNLIWRFDVTRLNREMNDLQAWLKQLLTVKRNNLNWLVAWCDENTSLPHVKRKDFWGGSLKTGEEISVPPSFTVKGKKEIDEFLKEMEAALPEPVLIAGRKIEFEKWYENAFVSAWQNFAAAFLDGKKLLDGRNEWKRVASEMASGKGPFSLLMATLDDELGLYKDREDLPGWVGLVFKFHAAKQAAKAQNIKNTGLLKKAMQKGGRLFSNMGKLSGVSGEKRLESLKIAAGAFKDYKSGIYDIAAKAGSRKEAFKMTSQVFNEDQVTGSSPFYTVYNAINRFRSAVSEAKEGEDIYWNLMKGPLDFLWEYYRNETACYLQLLWEKEVLIEIESGGEPKDVVEKFVKGPASPFVDRSPRRKGYFPKKALGKKIPLKTNFFTALTHQLIAVKKVKIKDNYRVTIKALPTGVNPGAQIKPHVTTLQVQCEDKTLELVNLNFPVRRVFNWSPQKCGDVVLKIEVGNRVLVKRYGGDMPFRSFLNDFPGGRHKFRRGDFPDQAPALKRMGIKYILVNYKFRGEHGAIKGLPTASSVRSRTPGEIALCWGH